MAQIEERRFTRVPIRAWVSLMPEDGSAIQCDSTNLSMNGVLVRTDRPLPVGAECFTTIILGEPSNPLTITARGRVARQDGEDVGVHFTEIELDSFEHLRRLVSLNAADVELVEDELDAHVGLRPRGPALRRDAHPYRFAALGRQPTVRSRHGDVSAPRAAPGSRRRDVSARRAAPGSRRRDVSALRAVNCRLSTVDCRPIDSRLTPPRPSPAPAPRTGRSRRP